MTKVACVDYVDRALVALQDMREMLDNSTPDTVLGFLEGAQDVHDLVSRAVATAITSIILEKTEG